MPWDYTKQRFILTPDEARKRATAKAIRRLDLTANVHVCNRRLSPQEKRKYPEFVAEQLRKEAMQ